MLNQRPLTAALAALLITFDNALIIQSRFILLDSPLLFFTALAIFFHIGFCNEDIKQPLTPKWWLWLSLTGLSLGAILSSKWIGLFTIAALGFITIKQLWNLLGDLSVPIHLLIRSFLARFVCLALLPLVFYLFIFQIHFWILSSSGEGDAFMSSEFQQTLSGHGMVDTFADVLIGSNVTIKHTNTLGGYLHSHAQYYPTGSQQQQITLYPHQDENNVWTVLGRLSDDVDVIHRKPPDYYYKNRVSVNGSMFIRLNHPLTDKRLHTHDIRAPVSEVEYQNEVSGYGFLNYPGKLYLFARTRVRVCVRVHLCVLIRSYNASCETNATVMMCLIRGCQRRMDHRDCQQGVRREDGPDLGPKSAGTPHQVPSPPLAAVLLPVFAQGPAPGLGLRAAGGHL
jgi:dolichyl-phosphate-mannose-protein mannosyltransferase